MEYQRFDEATCPFCPFTDPDSTFVTEHVEYCHPENRAGPVHQITPGDNPIKNFQGYTDCPQGCGEQVADTDLSTHLDLHIAEGIAFEDTYITERKPPLPASLVQGSEAIDESVGYDKLGNSHSARQESSRDGSRQSSSTWGIRSRGAGLVISDPETSHTGIIKRLGRAELGPYAHEKQMPVWLQKMLERGGTLSRSNIISPDGTIQKHQTFDNEAIGIITTLARLCEQDKSVQRTFLCSSNVHQVSKIPGEGGFCGYRNIQMMISYIKESKVPGHEVLPGPLPTILQLQDMIERAWDMGFNSQGRLETGGIRGTRKYIGTPEVQALFLSLGIRCEARNIATVDQLQAHDVLFANVAEYFRSAASQERDAKVSVTDLPPIYLQHQGHSLTVVGFEIRDNGNANLLVFDPMFRPSNAVRHFKRTGFAPSTLARILSGYRRGATYLQKYKVFEILKLSVPPVSAGA